MTSLVIPTLQPEAFPVAKIRPSPCTLACPAGINVKGYVSLMAEGRHAEALETIRRRCPLPGVCGRICHHPCEKACRRGRYDEPVSIRSLKRFAADFAPVAVPAPPPVTHGERVAIVGSGPAGLTAAYDLRLAGFGVTVFEAAPDPGGMLRYGIADYRLPRAVLDAEIEILVRSGVEIRTGIPVGSSIELDDLLYEGYSATLLAIGAQKGRSLEGAEDALSFLRRVKEGDRSPIEGRVLVIGGGSTAVEAARTALRLGAHSVEILYRRYREELLADREEIEAAEAEGVRFRFLVTPRRKTAGGLECVTIGLGEPDATGRRRPIEIPGSEFVIPTEHVFAAVGQRIETTFLPNELLPSLAGRERLVVNETTAMTSINGIFAAGDAVTGPATVVEAIGAGHRAAESIRHFLEEGAAAIREQKPERRAPLEYELKDPEPVRSTRVQPPLTMDGFHEVERSFTEEEAVAEARRCLRCGPCGECRACAPSCARRHVIVRRDAFAGAIDDEELEDDGPSGDLLLRVPASLATALASDRAVRATIDGTATSVLAVRCSIDHDRCRACGRCVDVCSFSALRMVDDHIHLDAALCRGCGLCEAVCPTAALQWSGGLDPADILNRQSRREEARRAKNPGEKQPDLVLACQRRTGSVANANVVRLRCVGQIDAGLLLELQRDPARKIRIAGCAEDRCRFGCGASHAAEQIERARTIAEILKLDPDNVIADWSPDRLHDPLDGGH